jgi:hypothetical protein
MYLIRYHYLANPSATEDVDILAADSTLDGGWALIEAPSFEVAAQFARQTWGESPVVPPAGRYVAPLTGAIVYVANGGQRVASADIVLRSLGIRDVGDPDLTLVRLGRDF